MCLWWSPFCSNKELDTDDKGQMEIWHPFHNLQDIALRVRNTYNSLPENWKEMIAFEYNAFYNNSLVCMKFKTAGFPNMIFKK